MEKFGFKAIRADHISKPGMITNQIVDHILNDQLVIADLTGHNANVFYELAVRHVIQKPIIQFIQKGERIPFDVSSQRTIEIDHKDLDSVDEAKKELERQLVTVEKDPTLVDSPILTAISIQSLKGSSNPEQTAIVSIQGTLSNLVGEMREIRSRLPRESALRWSTNDESSRLKEFLNQIAIGEDLRNHLNRSDAETEAQQLVTIYKEKLDQLERHRKKTSLSTEK